MRLKIKRKHRKGQVIFIETILVMCTYLFLIGFMITCFQIFHTKMIFNIAAYEGVRQAVMVMDDDELSQDFTKDDFYQERTDGLQNLDYDVGKVKAQVFCEKNCIAYNRISSGAQGVDVYYTQPDNGVFTQCVVWGEIEYLFPMISPNFIFDKEPLSNDIRLVESCTLAHRRIYRGMGGEDIEE